MKRTFKILISLISLVAVLSLLVVPALADGPDDDAKKKEPGMTGGAAYDPNRVLTLTPKQQQEWEQKLAEAQRLLEIIREAEEAGDNGILGGSPMIGSCYMGLWKEPEEEPDWCGPGSGTAVISNWRDFGMPALDYMAYLANHASRPCQEGETPPCKGMMIDDKTWADDWVHIVNNEIGQWFYGIYHPSGVNSYKSKLQIDIWGADHPLAQIVWTWDLPDWGAWPSNHYLGSNEYNFYANKVRYGDSAPDSATPHGNPFGWHWVDIDDFYDNHINHIESFNLIIW